MGVGGAGEEGEGGKGGGETEDGRMKRGRGGLGEKRRSRVQDGDLVRGEGQVGGEGGREGGGELAWKRGGGLEQQRRWHSSTSSLFLLFLVRIESRPCLLFSLFLFLL